MSAPTTAELLASLRAWCAEQAPGLVPSALTVHFHNNPVPLSLPIGASRAAGGQAAEDGPDRRHSRCVDDILEVLAEAGVPLTTTRMMSALSLAGREWSQRYVEKCLAEMVRDGTLENPPDARPRGYRLPEWESGGE